MSENAAKEVRGMVVSVINVMLFVGITTSATVIVTVTYVQGDNFNSDRVIGIIGLIVAVVSVVCEIFLGKESVAYLLGRNRDNEAMACMKDLRGETNESWRLTDDIQELHAMVQEDERVGKNIFTGGNGKPLALISVLVALGVFIEYHFIQFPWNRNGLVEFHVRTDNFSLNTSWNQYSVGVLLRYYRS